MLIKQEWFMEWFNSPYYHTLYSNRDNNEAGYFLSRLVAYLHLNPAQHRIIDLACGTGRHSIYLNSLGFEVLGVDISENSIAQARQFENSRLRFEVQDLRELNVPAGNFNLALNLFTSFGYFQSRQENNQVVRLIHQILAPYALLVVDFMNSGKVLQHLIEHESKTIGGFQFHINKWTENNCICKKISVTDHGRDFEFVEKVQALTLEDFQSMLTENGFRIIETFGDYDLNPFSHADSDRLILITQKI